MRSRIYGLLAAVCLILAVTSVVKAADTVSHPVTGGSIKFDKSTKMVTGYDGSVTEVDIPEAIEGVRVTSIGEFAFLDCTSLTSVSIPNSVTSIRYGAFNVCTSLASITVAADNPSFSSIEGVLFNKDATVLYTCPGGKGGVYSIPSGVTAICGSAFENCTSLTSATIPDSVTSIGDFAFRGCTGLTNVTIPDSVTFMGRYAFMDCPSLTSVNIPNSETSIRDWAFSGCTGLTSVTIPDSVTSIGNWTFSGCTGLTSVTIPDSVTCIVYGAFDNCPRLTDVYYDGTQAEYEAKLRSNVSGGNDWFLNAPNFHFKDDPSPNTTPTLPNTAASDHTAFHGVAFLLLAALTLTVWALGRRKKDRES